MKPRWICVVAALLSLALAVPSSAKNSVYKGTYTSTDLVAGQVITASVYLVLGDEVPIDPENDAYAKISATMIFFGPPLGKKRYAVGPARTFRTVEVPKTVKGRERTVEIISQVAETSPTDGDLSFHSGVMLVLTGTHTNPLYDVPLTLKGTGLMTRGQLVPDDAPPFGSASRQSVQLKLATTLTDPIPTGEPLADSVKRVTDFLESRGFVRFAP